MRIFIIALIFSLCGCATVGTKIDSEKVKQIEAGKTTKADVIAMFGQPMQTVLTSDGKEIMMFQYCKVKNRPSNFIPVVGLLNSGMDMDQQILQVLVGPAGVVEKSTLSDSKTPINSGLLNQ